MPFKSEKQRRFLWANEPEVAREWSRHQTPRKKKRDRTNWRREKTKER